MRGIVHLSEQFEKRYQLPSHRSPDTEHTQPRGSGELVQGQFPFVLIHLLPRDGRQAYIFLFQLKKGSTSLLNSDVSEERPSVGSSWHLVGLYEVILKAWRMAL